MEDFHVHFEKTNQTYDFTFREQQNASPDTVLVDGRNYKLEGDSVKVARLKEQLQLSSESSISKSTLKDRLISLDVTGLDISVRKTVDDVSEIGKQNIFKAKVRAYEDAKFKRRVSVEETFSPSQQVILSHYTRMKEEGTLQAITLSKYPVYIIRDEDGERVAYVKDIQIQTPQTYTARISHQVARFLGITAPEAFTFDNMLFLEKVSGEELLGYMPESQISGKLDSLSEIDPLNYAMHLVRTCVLRPLDDWQRNFLVEETPDGLILNSIDQEENSMGSNAVRIRREQGVEDLKPLLCFASCLLDLPQFHLNLDVRVIEWARSFPQDPVELGTVLASLGLPDGAKERMKIIIQGIQSGTITKPIDMVRVTDPIVCKTIEVLKDMGIGMAASGKYGFRMGTASLEFIINMAKAHSTGDLIKLARIQELEELVTQAKNETIRRLEEGSSDVRDTVDERGVVSDFPFKSHEWNIEVFTDFLETEYGVSYPKYKDIESQLQTAKNESDLETMFESFKQVSLSACYAKSPAMFEFIKQHLIDGLNIPS